METAIKPTIPINGKLYFNLKGAAAAARRSVTTIRREMSRKRIRYLDYGRDKLFLPEWIDEYIEKLIVAPKKIIKQ